VVGKKQNYRDEGLSLHLLVPCLFVFRSFSWLTFQRQNLSALSSLKILSIQSNRITSTTGLSELHGLEELYISHNGLTDLSGLESNTALRILDFSNNQVSKLENIVHLTNLEELWGSNNALSSFEEVERELKDKENLETVYFEGNPLQTNSPALYRNKVRLALPQVKQIDASKFNHLDRGCGFRC
jgi:protein phosphatase 1 regulatory subunit 7